MPAYPESVSDKRPSDSVLIVGVNWLGDSLMSMPAIQAYRQAHPRTRLVMLVKPKLASLWTLHRAPDELWMLPEGLSGLIQTACRAAPQHFRSALILPHSFRSAAVPFLARIPERVGMPGHARDWMLTRIVHPPAIPGQEHQSHEYRALLGVSDRPMEYPHLSLPEALVERARSRLGVPQAPRVVLMPGAARGPAKRWPAHHFITLGRLLKTTLPCAMVILGSASERELCEQVAQGIGSGTVNLAGQTSLPELAAILSQCMLGVANDSGGMHLAAAVGVPVLAIFGITDPQKTAPLGPWTRVLQAGDRRNRDIQRRSTEAEQSLSRLQPEQALEAARELLARVQASRGSGEHHAR